MARVLHKAIRQFEFEKCPKAFDLRIHIDQLLTHLPDEESIRAEERERLLAKMNRRDVGGKYPEWALSDKDYQSLKGKEQP